MNPYEVLGVDVTATAEDIRRAHREKAFRHHPDRPGGDARVFKRLQLCYEVLIDEGRRKAYDETGATEKPEGEDRVLLRAVGLLTKTFGDILVGLYEAGADPTRVALLELMKERIEDEENILKKEIAAASKYIATLRGVAGRFHAKPGENSGIMHRIIGTPIAELETKVTNATSQIDVCQVALNIIKDHRYEHDRSTKFSFYGGGATGTQACSNFEAFREMFGKTNINCDEQE
jgi:curved DNA-binding protein CbpA